MSSAPQIKLEQFEGSLDLLLHLIKVNEINIFSIDLLFLANQYFAVLRLVEFRDLATAGDFLQTAATLVEIKSRSLLPDANKNEHTDLNELLEDDDSLPRDFKERLITYYQIKQGAQYLQGRYLRDYRFSNHEWQRLSTLPAFQRKQLPRGDKWGLVILYEQLLTQVAKREAEIPQPKVQKIKLEAVMATIMQKLTELTAFQDFYPLINSRHVYVVYFIAILELAKEGKINISQEKHDDTLWLYSV